MPVATADRKIAALETQTGISESSRSLRQGWGLFLVVALLLLGAAFWLDAAAFSWVAQHKSPAGVAFMRGVSRWGDWYSHVIAGLILAGFAYARGNRRWCHIFVSMLIACAIAGTVARVVKVSAGRARPSVRTDTGWNGPRLSSKYNAFPSGHTASSAAFFAALTFACWRFGAALLWIPLLIAFSRMYVGAHHLSDVVCAAVIGIGTAWFVVRWQWLRTQLEDRM